MIRCHSMSKSVVDTVPTRIVGEQQEHEQHDMEDDKWTEYTMEQSVNEEQQQACLSAILASKGDVDDIDAAKVVVEQQKAPEQDIQDDDDEWTEYTVEETVAKRQQQEQLDAVLANKSSSASNNSTPVSNIDNIESYESCDEDLQDELDALAMPSCMSDSHVNDDMYHEDLQDELNALAMPSFTSDSHENDDDKCTEIIISEEDHAIAEPVTSPVSLGGGTFAPRQQQEQSSCNNNDNDNREEKEEDEDDGFMIHLQMNPSSRKMDSITDETGALSNDKSTAYKSAREDHGALAPGSPMSVSSSSACNQTAC